MTTLLWDVGTAYDFFISLRILNNPADHGLRKSWARGVRARLAPENRTILDVMSDFVAVPMHYLAQLDAPKNSQHVIERLAALSPVERLRRVSALPALRDDMLPLLLDIAQQGGWDDEQMEQFLVLEKERPNRRPRRRQAEPLLNLWADAEAAGEQYLAALREYREVFFAEEEQRIGPVLQQALADARALAEQMDLPELLEELSQGVRYDRLLEYDELQLVPSFWSTPLIISGRISSQRRMLIFGARPENMSLVPGDVVPDALYQALKALADPTRLRILRYLSSEPLTPAELARRLRLRPPTVSHHLNALRLARLVHFSIEKGDKRRYAIRPGAVGNTYQGLKSFLHEE